MSALGNQVTEMPELSARPKNTALSGRGNQMYLGRLPSVSSESSLASLFSNLRDFLTERPPKMRAGTPTAFDMPRFGSSLSGNLSEFFRSGPRGRVNSGLLVNWDQEPGLWQNLRDWIAPRRLPPLKTTSKPVAVPDIWSKNTQYNRMQMVSIIVHAVAIAAIILIPLFLPAWIPQPVTKAIDLQSTDISPYIAKLNPAAQKAGGGGGAHYDKPATQGKLPKFSWEQFAAPVAKPILHPQIAMTPTVVGNPDIKFPNMEAQKWGDPFSKANTDSMGQGHGSGVGNGNGAGVGPGEGWNTGGGYPNAGTGGYGEPICLYCPKPDFSDEAVKVKVMGVVELTAIITPDGRVTDIHLAKGLGFGLDDKVIEAVRTWRLKPALGPNGKPAAVRQTIEIQYQIY
jgi:periplasmic protein TonB